jgi:integrase
MLTAARLFFAWTQATGRRQDNPAALLSSISVVTGAPRPCPEPALRAAMLAADESVRLMIALGAGAGCRRAEIAAARRDDLEYGVGGPALRINGKGSRERTVPIFDALAGMISRRPEGWLFPSPYGGHLKPETVGKRLSSVLPGDLTAHTLRHRFASAAYAVDQDLRAVQELLGHASVATTQIYTALPTGAKRRAAAGASLALTPLAAVPASAC